MIEGLSQSTHHKNSPTHRMQDKASLSGTEQRQRVGETQLSSYVVTSRFVETSQGISQQLHENVWITKGRNTKYRDSETKRH